MPAAVNSSARRGRAPRNACRGTGCTPAGSAARNVSANNSASRSMSSWSLAAANLSKNALTWLSRFRSDMAAPEGWCWSEEVGETFQQRRGRGELPALGSGAARLYGLDYSVDDGLLADGERRPARVGKRHDRLATVPKIRRSFDEPSLMQGADRNTDSLNRDPLAVGELTGRG